MGSEAPRVHLVHCHTGAHPPSRSPLPAPHSSSEWERVAASTSLPLMRRLLPLLCSWNPLQTAAGAAPVQKNGWSVGSVRLRPRSGFGVWGIAVSLGTTRGFACIGGDQGYGISKTQANGRFRSRRENSRNLKSVEGGRAGLGVPSWACGAGKGAVGRLEDSGLQEAVRPAGRVQLHLPRLRHSRDKGRRPAEEPGRQAWKRESGVRPACLGL